MQLCGHAKMAQPRHSPLPSATLPNHIRVHYVTTHTLPCLAAHVACPPTPHPLNQLRSVLADLGMSVGHRERLLLALSAAI